MLDLREAGKERQEVAQHQHRIYSEDILQSESLAPRLDHIAIYRLGVDIGGIGEKVQGRLLGRKNVLWVTKECCYWAIKEIRCG
jgi:hypothetical protein